MSQENGHVTRELKTESSGFNIREFFSKYGKYLPFIAISIILGLIAGFLKIRYADPVYQIKSALLIKDERYQGSSDDNRFMSLFMAGGESNINNEIEILKSRPLIGRVVKSLNLQWNYWNQGKIRSSLLYKDTPFTLDIVRLKDSAARLSLQITVLSPNEFRINKQSEKIAFGQIFRTDEGSFRLVRNPSVDFGIFDSNIFFISYSDLPTAVENVVGSLKIQRTQDFSRILEISFLSQNILLGKDVLNQLMKEYAIMNIDDKNKIAVNTLRFIDERLDSLGSELGGVESNLQSFRERNQAIDLEQQSGFYFENLKDIEDMLQRQAINLKIVEYLDGYMRNTANIYQNVPSNLGIEEPTLVPLITEYNSKILQRESYLKNTPEQNVIIQDLNVQIDKIREDILETLNNVRQSYEITRNDLQRRANTMRSQVQAVPGKAKGLLEITRQQKIKEELFLILLQKKEETAIASASTISSSKVVEPATASNVPVKPSKGPIYLLYTLIALVLPIIAIFIIEVLNDKITSKKDIERNSSVPILGEVGHTIIKNDTLVVTNKSRTVIAEQFRILRTSMQYVLKDTKKPVILVSSTFSGEGKSFITTNLAAAIALSGKRTVILEFDIRKPKIMAGFNLKRTQGITNFIVGNSTIEELVVQIPESENLYVIPCGPIPPNPAELLLDEKIGQVFDYCKSNFDVVLVDTAPAGLVSDAFVLSKFSNCCLYIVRQSYTYKKQLEFIDEVYQSKKLPQMALILNDVKSKGNHYGYSYGGYGYGYGYGYKGYYDDDIRERGMVSRIRKAFQRNGKV
jgi:tyrosine-protein kinase Etk/Wzc